MFQNMTSFISSIGMFVVTLFYVIYIKKILKANQGMFEEATIARKQESMR
jgi:Ca2+/Na+ antiporter